jgi:hypothetical protein
MTFENSLTGTVYVRNDNVEQALPAEFVTATKVLRKCRI